MKDFKFLSDNHSQLEDSTGIEEPIGLNGFTQDNMERIAQEMYMTYYNGHYNGSKARFNKNYEPMNDSNIVNHTKGFILNLYLYGLIITYLVKLFVNAGF